MTRTRKSLLFTATIFASLQMIATASPALAQVEAPAQLVATVDAADILWVEASLTDGLEGRVRTKILTPRNARGSRTLWQVCTFNYTGAGEYRCGIDVSDGSYAGRLSGTWVVKVLAGADQLDRETFSL